MPDLEDLCIMVTRPAGQAQSLCQLIEQAGAQVVLFPTLEITDVSNTKEIYSVINNLDKFNLAIFISVNAVNQAVKYIQERGTLPATLKLATIGKASAVALHKILGRGPDICPETQFTSEALLALEPMQELKNQSIVIFRGQQGREYLGAQLRQRGAKVEYVSVYCRKRPNADMAKFEQQRAKRDIDAIIITSEEGLRNLCGMLEKQLHGWLKKTQLIVMSQRIFNVAQALGFQKKPIVAREASDEAIVQAIKHWQHIQ